MFAYHFVITMIIGGFWYVDNDIMKLYWKIILIASTFAELFCSCWDFMYILLQLLLHCFSMLFCCLVTLGMMDHLVNVCSLLLSSPWCWFLRLCWILIKLFFCMSGKTRSRSRKNRDSKPTRTSLLWQSDKQQCSIQL